MIFLVTVVKINRNHLSIFFSYLIQGHREAKIGQVKGTPGTGDSALTQRETYGWFSIANKPNPVYVIRLWVELHRKASAACGFEPRTQGWL